MLENGLFESLMQEVLYSTTAKWTKRKLWLKYSADIHNENSET